MTRPEARPDLVRSLLQSCYVVEHARLGTQRRWGGDFERDAEGTAKRTERLGKLLDDEGIRRPDEVIEPHTQWFLSFCGYESDEVAMGAAVLHVFSRWADVFARPYLGEDEIHGFVEAAAEYSRADAEVRTMNESEAFLPDQDLPDGQLFAILTDCHIGSKRRDELLRRAVAEINDIGVEFVLVPGDFTEDGEPEQFQEAKDLFEGLHCPYYAVLGNHDAVQRSTRLGTGKEFFEQTWGTPETDHVVEIGNLQIALVDSTDPTASPFPDWDISKGSVGGIAAGVDSGTLEPGQLDELVKRLDPNKRTLLVQHHEVHPFPGFPPVKFALREEDAYAETDALAKLNPVGVIAGHTHRSAALPVGRNGEITQLEIPALKDWPHAYSVVGVTNDAVKVVVRQVADKDLIWRFSKDLLPLQRRFHLGPWADLAYTFTS